jgi:hypothetical protein
LRGSIMGDKSAFLILNLPNSLNTVQIFSHRIQSDGRPLLNSS